MDYASLSYTLKKKKRSFWTIQPASSHRRWTNACQSWLHINLLWLCFRHAFLCTASGLNAVTEMTRKEERPSVLLLRCSCSRKGILDHKDSWRASNKQYQSNIEVWKDLTLSKVDHKLEYWQQKQGLQHPFVCKRQCKTSAHPPAHPWIQAPLSL